MIPEKKSSFVAVIGGFETVQHPGAVSQPIFTEANTPLPGCIAMQNTFTSPDYPAEPGVHDDNEGFYVISGQGMMRVGDCEAPLSPGTAAYAPAGVPHAIRKTGDADLEVFIYHFPK